MIKVKQRIPNKLKFLLLILIFCSSCAKFPDGVAPEKDKFLHCRIAVEGSISSKVDYYIAIKAIYTNPTEDNYVLENDDSIGPADGNNNILLTTNGIDYEWDITHLVQYKDKPYFYTVDYTDQKAGKFIDFLTEERNYHNQLVYSKRNSKHIDVSIKLKDILPPSVDASNHPAPLKLLVNIICVSKDPENSGKLEYSLLDGYARLDLSVYGNALEGYGFNVQDSKADSRSTTLPDSCKLKLDGDNRCVIEMREETHFN